MYTKKQIVELSYPGAQLSGGNRRTRANMRRAYLLRLIDAYPAYYSAATRQHLSSPDFYFVMLHGAGGILGPALENPFYLCISPNLNVDFKSSAHHEPRHVEHGLNLRRHGPFSSFAKTFTDYIVTLRFLEADARLVECMVALSESLNGDRAYLDGIRGFYGHHFKLAEKLLENRAGDKEALRQRRLPSGGFMNAMLLSFYFDPMVVSDDKRAENLYLVANTGALGTEMSPGLLQGVARLLDFDGRPYMNVKDIASLGTLLEWPYQDGDLGVKGAEKLLDRSGSFDDPYDAVCDMLDGDPVMRAAQAEAMAQLYGDNRIDFTYKLDNFRALKRKEAVRREIMIRTPHMRLPPAVL